MSSAVIAATAEAAGARDAERSAAKNANKSENNAKRSANKSENNAKRSANKSANNSGRSAERNGNRNVGRRVQKAPVSGELTRGRLRTILRISTGPGFPYGEPRLGRLL